MTTAEAQPRRLSLRLQGLVQGVGFRPHAHRLATELGLRGWVRNGGDGVELELEGPEESLRRFRDALASAPPPRCRIDRLVQRWGAPCGDLPAFRIRAAPAGAGGGSALVSPDLAICPACLAELADPRSRRHQYPFISCTDCGPRYSVLERLPFERANTSLAAFPLCPGCRREYGDPADRRFHAQTISCPACGPRLRWRSAPGGGEADGEAVGAAAIAAAAEALRRGRIVALQGIGGFQLLVDATQPEAVAELRRRKGRPDKPLALLGTHRWLECHCRLSAAEEALWWSPAAPILLLRRREQVGPPAMAGLIDPQTRLADGVAPDSPWLGVMRPASAVHQLLLEACGEVLVATSANRSGEPMARDAVADADLLRQLADGVLRHDLPILNPIDDSVMRLALDAPLVLRLGRGLAPLALPAPSSAPQPAPPVLALGAQLKGSLALQLPQVLLLSPDLGDVGSRRGARHLQDTLERWLLRHGLQPRTIACDAHPGYSSRQLAEERARELAVPMQPVQHHHAHLLAVLAEHDLAAPALGVAWDGSGQGDDGSLWGGEALVVSATGYRRVASLRPFPLPGGERGLREPRRAALGLLLEAYGPGWRERLAFPGAAPWRGAFSADELAVLELAVARGHNSPRCSSVGRLFDAVAALLGLRQHCSYEAQAAIALEGLAAAVPSGAVSPRYRLPLLDVPDPSGGWTLPPDRDPDAHGRTVHPPSGLEVPWQWDWRPLLADLLRDHADPAIPTAAIALAFHRALAEAIAALADRVGRATHGGRLLLGGGCFQNALLLELSVAALRRRGIVAFWPQRLPCNDAALAMGQLLSAPTTPITRSAPWAVRHVSRRTG
ncbi:MAG: carbamoyltransferase HypF [Cyanobacteriota bacterium]